MRAIAFAALAARAFQDLDKGQFTQARLLLQTFLGTFPTSDYVEAALYGLGEARYREGAMPEADAEFRRYQVFFPGGELSGLVLQRLEEIRARLVEGTAES